MKRKVFKKMVGALGLFASASIVAASCFNSTKTLGFDQNDDGKIVLANTYSSTSPIAKALEEIVDQYNKQKPQGDYPVELFSIAGGYGGGDESVNTKLASKDKTQFFNLIFNYPNVTAQLVRHGQALKLNKGEQAVDASIFSDKFLEENYSIPGNDDRSIYSLPLTRSTEVLVINAPVVYQLLSQAKAANDLMIADNAETKALWDSWKEKAKINLGSSSKTMMKEMKKTMEKDSEAGSAAGAGMASGGQGQSGSGAAGSGASTGAQGGSGSGSQSGSSSTGGSQSGSGSTGTGVTARSTNLRDDQNMTQTSPAAGAETPAMAKEAATTEQPAAAETVSSDYIKKLWGDYQSVDGGLKGYTLDANVFNATKGLIDLSVRIAKSYSTKLKAPNDRQQIDPQAVLGIDSPSNFLYTNSFSQVNGNWNEFLVRKSSNGKTYDFNALLNNDNNRAAPLMNTFNAVKPLIDANGLFLNNGGNYSSNWEKFHQLAFFLGSTSGYYQSFVDDKEGSNLVFKNVDMKVASYEFPRFTSDLYAPTKTEYGQGAIGAFNNRGKRYVIYKKESLTEELKKVETNKAIPDEMNRATAETALSNRLKTIESSLATMDNQATIQIGWIGTGFDLDKFNSAVKPKIHQLGNLYDKKYKAAFVLDTDAEKKIVPTEQSLQAKEADIRIAPKKFDQANTKEIVMTQGASLIGIHANEKEDIQTKKFINWLIKTGNINVPAVMKKGKVETPAFTGTPLNFIVDRASYILPTNEFLNNPNVKDNKTEYQKIAIDAFKSIQSDNNYVPYNDVPDFRSGTFRKTIDSTLVSANSTKADFAKFFDNLKKASPDIVKRN
ncbi:P80 family lipoprotein [Mycoplasma sp. T363T]|uniref:P68 family surface lipoprotein n=1 Tax=Mycoplasma bradburyae TaxID=2963128 RepID=UPI002340E61D|nr:P80 family lipoprotein [Mycoplasma bradburyae]MDC4163252.1 P80 family lipoprotein [Mycoplasma bradburyae]